MQISWVLVVSSHPPIGRPRGTLMRCTYTWHKSRERNAHEPCRQHGNTKQPTWCTCSEAMQERHGGAQRNGVPPARKSINCFAPFFVLYFVFACLLCTTPPLCSQHYPLLSSILSAMMDLLSISYIFNYIQSIFSQVG